LALEFSGRGLFVYSDPGGAKAVLAMAKSLKPTLLDIRIVSDRSYDFANGFEVDVSLPAGTASQEINKFNPTFVFCGTSYSSKIELDFISAAKEKKILTASFVDHWTSFLIRFENQGELIFPDRILVIDERAKDLAISEGLPEDRIFIFGNPYYDYLKQWKPLLTKKDFCKSIGISQVEKPLIVYAPDPLSNVGGITKFGFDEIEATRELTKFLKSRSLDLIFIFKPHPNQKMEKITNVSENMLTLDSEVDSNTLMYYSDMVIGFFSNFLIEASMMNKKILRYHLRKPIYDPIADLGIGEVVDTENLFFQLEQTCAK
jgi:hypothetical protein